LNYYALAPWQTRQRPCAANGPGGTASQKSRILYRCSIDLFDYKRGTVRMELFNNIFRLVDLRHEIHEKAVFHRVVQAANAMLSRTILLLKGKRPDLADLFGLGSGKQPGALCGEDHFLDTLIQRSNEKSSGSGQPN